MTPKLSLRQLTKVYPGSEVAAVDHIDLDVAAGETLALLGSSGCGKSTTLNMVVGLEHPTSGDIQIDGQSIVSTPAGKRNVGLVFQDYAVFTSMTVRQNLAFGLTIRKRPKDEVARAVAEVAELLGMADKLDAKANDLGGSELQRVAIGRTLVTRPAILLLDEPLSNLETAARLTMRRELRRLQKDIGLTIIYVTHDQIEALSLADHIAVMSAGKIRQVEAATKIMENPAHTFVASFLGEPPMNLIRGKVTAGVFNAEGFVLPLGDFPDGIITLGIRPQGLGLVAAGGGQITGRLLHVEPRGAEAALTMDCGGKAVKLLVPGHMRPVPGEDYGLILPEGALMAFDGDTNLRLPKVPHVAEVAQ